MLLGAGPDRCGRQTGVGQAHASHTHVLAAQAESKTKHIGRCMWPFGRLCLCALHACGWGPASWARCGITTCGVNPLRRYPHKFCACHRTGRRPASGRAQGAQWKTLFVPSACMRLCC